MKILRILALSAMFLAAENASAATGEMGTGVPHFGVYSAATGMQIVVFSIANPTRPFPAGCTNIVLTPTTMGIDSYKMALATLTAAKLAERPVRFYAHGERDNGCGVDYVQID
jgi:ABC-type enterochelin transport system permease subunit